MNINKNKVTIIKIKSLYGIFLGLLIISCQSNKSEEKTTEIAETVETTENEELLNGNVSLDYGSNSYQFKNGFPVGETASQIYYNSDLRRAVEAYKIFLPTLATEAVFQQMENAGAVYNTKGTVMAQGPRQQFAATNSDTPYAFILLDLTKGPMVVEMPANPLLLGVANDHNMGWLTDVGGIGPEKGKGGKHLVLPPGFDGNVPEGYYVIQGTTNKIVFAIRTVPLDGDVPKAIKAAQKIKAYPLDSPEMKDSFSITDITANRLELPLLNWEGKMAYWENLDKVLKEDIFKNEYRFPLGMLSELGMTADKPFSPSVEMKELLTRAAEIAHAELSTSLFENRRPIAVEWEDRNWRKLPVGPFNKVSGDFGSDKLIDFDASANFFFFGWGTSSAIGRREPGGGSMYFSAFKDIENTYFDGKNNYEMTIPGPVPMKLFWSVTVYDAFTRCLIETDLNRAAVRSHLDSPIQNEDGSYTIYFGPKSPEGKEANWVQTIPNRGWFTTVRLYGPNKEVFDGSWKLSDIKRME